MNIALFGKQAWRIINEPQGLVASMFIPKYCNKDKFLKVQPKTGNSWIWKSLLIGNDVALKGMDVQV